MSDRVAIAPEATDPAGVAAILDRARQRGFHRFVLPDGADPPIAPGDSIELRREDALLPVDGSRASVPIRHIRTPEELERAVDATPDGGTLAVEWADDRVIPLENVVARRGRRFSLWTFARDPAEAPAALGALEHGADRVIVRARVPADIDRLEAVLERTLTTPLRWVEAPLTAVRPAGLGDRVLVDTTSMLRPEEGLLVGSSAALLFHVASEAVGSRFSRARPFRVNAGAAHSYVLLADGTTRYLAELEAGDAVLVVPPRGPPRSVRVGRIKIERRPMVVLSAEDEGRPRTVFLQEAETVRVSTTAGRRPVVGLIAGPSLEAVRLPAARHLGTAIDEAIEER